MTGYIERINAIAEDTARAVIDRMEAVAPARPFKSMPLHLTPNEVVQTLRSLGLQVPTKLEAAAASGQKLRNAEHRFPLKEIDAALSRHDVPITDRFRFKQAMVDCQILGN